MKLEGVTTTQNSLFFFPRSRSSCFLCATIAHTKISLFLSLCRIPRVLVRTATILVAPVCCALAFGVRIPCMSTMRKADRAREREREEKREFSCFFFSPFLLVSSPPQSQCCYMSNVQPHVMSWTYWHVQNHISKTWEISTMSIYHTKMSLNPHDIWHFDKWQPYNTKSQPHVKAWPAAQRTNPTHTHARSHVRSSTPCTHRHTTTLLQCNSHHLVYMTTSTKGKCWGKGIIISYRCVYISIACACISCK